MIRRVLHNPKGHLMTNAKESPQTSLLNMPVLH